MKTAAMMIALMTLTSAAFASDRNYVAPKPQASAAVEKHVAPQAAVAVSRDDGKVHFFHNAK